MSHLALTFSKDSRFTILYIILVLAGCSQPANYAPVKTVNEAILPDGAIRPRSVGKLKKAKNIRHGSVKETNDKNPSDRAPLKSYVKGSGGVFQRQRTSSTTSKIKQIQVANEEVVQLPQDLEGDIKEVVVDNKKQEKQGVNRSATGDLEQGEETVIAKSDQAVAATVNSQNKLPNNPKEKNVGERHEKNNDEKKSIISINNKKVLKLNFVWPIRGKVVKNFAQSDNKGIDIAGKTSQQVLAAEAGKAVYCGSGLTGYGNLIIIKHNQTYLTAYAHNKRLSVKEGQSVDKGQPIGEVGLTGFKKQILHFEIRKNGKSINPLTLLPKY